MKTSFLSHSKGLAVLALLLVGSSPLAQATSEPPAVDTKVLVAPTQAPIQLAWDRVGSPIQIRA